ncbi:MAG: PIG-L family deacetylase [Clostridia bacterium]|nr:PIG-L family deacetylase [Clostridia bacterium]
MKVLMIGAHQDDNEFRCGGLASKFVKKGYEVYFLSVCNGCGGHHILSPEETSRVRAKESAAVAKLLGIKQYDVWSDVDDCNVTADLAMRKRMIKYIRNISPDLVISHRTNDYHADHRATGQLVQDASYLVTVPHECPDAPAMKKMPVIMYYEDRFKNPTFSADLVLDMDDEIDTKLAICDLNVSQVYEWLAYEAGEVVPEDKEERFKWLKGMEITADTTDEEVMAAPRGYAVRFAKTAARFRKELIERYGEEKGSKIRYAEAYEVCEYGNPLTEEKKKEWFDF